LFAILGAVLVIVYFILAAFLPRWWAERIGELSDKGFARGITWGLFFGGLCTLVPLLQLLLASCFGTGAAGGSSPGSRPFSRSSSRCRI